MKPKRLVRSLHTWVGLAGAAFWLLAALTGALLVFRASLRGELPASPPHLGGPRAPVSAVVGDLETRMPEATLARLTVPAKPGQLWHLELREPPDTVAFYAWDGTFLEHRTDPKRLTRLLFDLHTGAILGRPGELLTALWGLALSLSVLTGVWLWPRRQKRRRKALLATERSPSRAV